MSFRGWEIEIVNQVSPPRKWEVEMLPWTEAQGFWLHYPHWLMPHLCSKAFFLKLLLSAFLCSPRLCHFTSGPFVTLFIFAFDIFLKEGEKRWPLHWWPGGHQVWPPTRSGGICPERSRYRTACSQSENLLHSHKFVLKHYLVKKGKIYNKKKIDARRYFFGFHMVMAKPFHGVDLYSESSK